MIIYRPEGSKLQISFENHVLSSLER